MPGRHFEAAVVPGQQHTDTRTRIATLEPDQLAPPRGSPAASTRCEARHLHLAATERRRFAPRSAARFTSARSSQIQLVSSSYRRACHSSESWRSGRGPPRRVDLQVALGDALVAQAELLGDTPGRGVGGMIEICTGAAAAARSRTAARRRPTRACSPGPPAAGRSSSRRRRSGGRRGGSSSRDSPANDPSTKLPNP